MLNLGMFVAETYEQTKAAVPVTVSLPVAVWLAWLGSVGIGLTGLALIWRFIIKASKLIHNVNEYGGVVIQIAKEFKSDSGSTLKDAINRIELAATEAKATALLAKSMTENLTNVMISMKREEN